jgi:hypothetical protein
LVHAEELVAQALHATKAAGNDSAGGVVIRVECGDGSEKTSAPLRPAR